MPQNISTRILSKNLSSPVTLSRIQKAYCFAPERALNQIKTDAITSTAELQQFKATKFFLHISQ
jgi:hypothetical protein